LQKKNKGMEAYFKEKHHVCGVYKAGGHCTQKKDFIIGGQR
jgi:hypothetical protein